MKPRDVLLALCVSAIAMACAAQQAPMYVPTDEEVRACDAQGGTIEPAYSQNEYVCLLPARPPS